MDNAKIMKTKQGRYRVDLNLETSELLDQATALFDLSRCEFLRRIIKAAMEAGPALSAENSQIVISLAYQIRMVGHNLDQLLHAIHANRAVGMNDLIPVLEAISPLVKSVETEIRSMTTAYSLRLRAAAELPELLPS